ncbi:hypothetical protein H9P43_003522 [Blastocladiella emersonii ATCC 22665]|nr:hypothetical protein H9P43_003522 [Blastocladiella emersonii ATCC 22665]
MHLQLGVLLAAAWLALIASAPAADAQLVRTLPSCLTRARTDKYGWTEPLAQAAADPGKVFVSRLHDVEFEYGAWASANLTTYVAATLLKDVMGVSTVLYEHPGSRGSYPRAGASKNRANVEIWTKFSLAEHQNFVVNKGTVEDLGMVGYAGRIAWFINRKVTERFPDLIFDSWKSFTRPEVLALLPPAGTTPTAKNADGTWLCDQALYPYCRNGMFVPPQCQGELFSTCKEFWHVDPGYSEGLNEQRIITMNLKLVIVYLGDQLVPKAFACAAQGNTACLLYYWRPEVLPASAELAMVHLPEYTSTCFDTFDLPKVGTNGSSLTCDWDSDQLIKIASSSLSRTNPSVGIYLKTIYFRDLDVNNLLNASSTPGVTVPEVACQWIKDNEMLWGSWIPSPPPGYIKLINQVDLGHPIGIVIAVLCAIVLAVAGALAGLVTRFGGHIAIKSASPPFLTLISIGAALVTCSVFTEVLPISTSVCEAHIYLLALGTCIALSSIIAKTARIYLLFGNKSMISMSIRNSKLLLSVVTMTAIDLVLLIIWDVTTGPRAERVNLSIDTFGNVCGSTSTGPGATAATVILALYHAGMVLATCWLAYKVRRVATTYNESKLIAVAAYCMAGACAVVVPVSLLSAVDLRVTLIVRAVGILFATVSVLLVLVGRPVYEALVRIRASAVSAGSAPGSMHGGGSGGGGGGAGGGGAKSFFQTNAGAQSNIGEQEPGSVTKMFEDAAKLVGGSGNLFETKKFYVGKVVVRLGAHFAMKQMGGLARRWREINIALLHEPVFSLQITYPTEKAHSLDASGELHTRRISAARIDPSTFSDDIPAGCFMLRLAGTSYLVQTKSPQEADDWVADLESTFGRSERSSVDAVGSAASGSSAVGIKSNSSRTSREGRLSFNFNRRMTAAGGGDMTIKTKMSSSSNTGSSSSSASRPVVPVPLFRLNKEKTAGEPAPELFPVPAGNFITSLCSAYLNADGSLADGSGSNARGCRAPSVGARERLNQCVRESCPSAAAEPTTENAVTTEMCAQAKCANAWAAVAGTLCLPLASRALVDAGVYLPGIPEETYSTDFLRQFRDHIALRGLPVPNERDVRPGMPLVTPATVGTVGTNDVPTVMPRLELGVCVATPPIGTPCDPSTYDGAGFPKAAKESMYLFSRPPGMLSASAAVGVLGQPFFEVATKVSTSSSSAATGLGVGNPTTLSPLGNDKPYVERDYGTLKWMVSHVVCDPETRKFVAGKLPGEKCSNTAQCRYGICSSGSMTCSGKALRVWPDTILTGEGWNGLTTNTTRGTTNSTESGVGGGIPTVPRINVPVSTSTSSGMDRTTVRIVILCVSLCLSLIAWAIRHDKRKKEKEAEAEAAESAEAGQATATEVAPAPAAAATERDIAIAPKPEDAPRPAPAKRNSV